MTLLDAIKTKNWHTANRLVANLLEAKLSEAFDRERRLLGQALLEMNADPMPVNWNKGWQWPWQIGGGGSETPYLVNGKWKLYVWNAKERKHYVYDFASDTFEND